MVGRVIVRVSLHYPLKLLTAIVVRPPNGSIVIKAMRVLWIGMKSGGNLEAARPAFMEERGVPVPWDNVFVDELKRALVACRVL